MHTATRGSRSMFLNFWRCSSVLISTCSSSQSIHITWAIGRPSGSNVVSVAKLPLVASARSSSLTMVAPRATRRGGRLAAPERWRAVDGDHLGGVLVEFDPPVIGHEDDVLDAHPDPSGPEHRWLDRERHPGLERSRVLFTDERVLVDVET